MKELENSSENTRLVGHSLASAVINVDDDVYIYIRVY